MPDSQPPNEHAAKDLPPAPPCMHMALPTTGLLHAGEDDAHGFGGLFSAAWHGRALKVYASGSNLLPTIHVSDLAAYVTALLASCAADTDWDSASPVASTSTSPANTTLRSLPTFGHTTSTVAAAAAAADAGAGAAGTGSLGSLGQYLLVADPKAVSQRDLVSAVSKALGCGQVKEAPLGQLLLGSQQVSWLQPPQRSRAKLP